MSVRLIISNTIAYTVATFIIFSSFIVTYNFFSYKPLFNQIILASIGVFWAFFALPLKNLIITSAKRKFIKGYYDIDSAINDISTTLSDELDRPTIFNKLSQKLDNYLEIEEITQIYAERDSNTNLKEYTLTEKPKEFHTLKLDHPLITHLKTNTDPQKISDLPDPKQPYLNQITMNSPQLILGFNSPECVEGILVLGAKSSGSKYTDKDLKLLKTVIHLVSAILYRLTPHDILQKEFEANQKKLYEAEKQALHLERLEVVNRIAKEVNHELRNPASVILHSIENILDPACKESDREELLGHIHHEANYMVKVIKSTLSLGKSDTQQKKSINLNDLIKTAITLVPEDGFSYEVTLDKLPDIKGIEVDLISVFSNLFINAKDAMDASGTITITSETKKTEILIKVKDTGKGIPKDLLSKIWEPYYTTDVTYGIGLGLNVVQKIIKAHNAVIWADSQEGRGTEFTITFPIA